MMKRTLLIISLEDYFINQVQGLGKKFVLKPALGKSRQEHEQ